MKKIIFALLAVVFTCMFSISAYAMDLGKLEKVEDTLIPDGKNAIISQKITAITNDKGEVAFPLYSKSKMLKVEAIKGSIFEKQKKVEYGDQKYNLIIFNEKNSQVIFEVSMNKEGVYKGKKAKLGDTFPGGVSMIEHKVVNTSPNAIKSYSTKIAVPKGKELLNIVGYDAKKAFNVTEKDGYIFGGFDFGGMSSGKETKFAINTFSPLKVHIILVWILAIILSVAFMIKNKHLLKGKKA
ncbi:hypothetical protein [Clostridium haemolyticum]|uniref:Uncharacterized protein n=1 Tax=Clostridium haemolyticum NCTC 9693 TaxID=1443114 RepID=A0ABR4TGL9_CLOHA|nr:hypothetical protein [Clostridium haemolyticum]KEI18089.1 hypothetical protein Z960_04565 [Clostridium haemolyticum NCTC 9693]KGN02792.1 hypothetical protein Z961_08110 [Clostridium haemolyticum NCTC 8350]